MADETVEIQTDVVVPVQEVETEVAKTEETVPVTEEQKPLPKKDSIKDDLLKERKRRQEVEMRLKELEGKFLDESFRATKTELKQQYVNDGFTDEVAERLAERDAKHDMRIGKLESAITTIASPVDNALKELADSDEFFSDAMSYKNEIAEKMKAHKGITHEEAYMLVHGKDRTQELKQNIEVRTRYEKQEVAQKAVPAAASGKSKELYPLDEEDKKTLKTLQSLDPGGNWTAEKFYKNKNR